ncbi:pppA, partial [Symbiodinium microadriaticum]
ALVEHKNYLYRISAILSARALSEVVGSDFIDTHLVPLVARMANDPVPNVRFNAAKTIKAMHEVCMWRPQNFNDKLVPCLYKMLADEVVKGDLCTMLPISRKQIGRDWMEFFTILVWATVILIMFLAKLKAFQDVLIAIILGTLMMIANADFFFSHFRIYKIYRVLRRSLLK